MKKILTIVVALAMVLALAISASAATLFELTQVGRNDTPAGANIVFADGVNWDEMGGWYPSALTEYMAPTEMAGFVAAVQTEGAAIRIAYDGDAAINILFQTYDNDYQLVTTEGTDILVASVEEDGHKVAYFDAAAMVKLYTDAGMTLDRMLNLGVSATGCTVYGISVVDAAPVVEAPADEPVAEDTPVENTDTPVEDTEAPAEEAPAETGLALSLIPAVIAMAVVALKRR